jgi:hypothetical protein
MAAVAHQFWPVLGLSYLLYAQTVTVAQGSMLLF